MDIRKELTRFHSEHEEMTEFLAQWERALEAAGSSDAEIRRAGLFDLARMDDRLAALREHCRAEEHEDARLQFYLEENVFEQLRADHELLERLTAAFRAELRRLTTPPAADDLVSHGRELLIHIRQHIAFEETLLKQIEAGDRAVEDFVFDASIMPK